jgi:2-polyprenyl-3-methyl-5-hydroxy-6-metoxy-1,4-benzoquinol methylase
MTVALVTDEHRVTPLLDCLVCGDRNLTTYCDLGSQPLANDYHDGTEELARFPLALNVCTSCFHSQLTHAVDPDLLYKNYLYVSGTTTTLLEYFDWFVDKVEADFGGKKLRVLDIASNDGTLLTRFVDRGHVVLGVDPAENLAELSVANHVPTYVRYWNASTAAEVRAYEEPFDVVIAMNVLAHVQGPLGFLTQCREVLAEDGRIYVQTSQCEMLERGEFDTVYHEHHSQFSARSFCELAWGTHLYVEKGQKVPIHGTSYLWTLSTSGVDAQADLVNEEYRRGYYDFTTYERFGNRVEETESFLQDVIDAYAGQGFACVGYGAAAKGNVVLNACQIDLDCIVDDNPLKVGLLTPGRDIPIVESSALATIEAPLCLVILAWNFATEIRQRVKAIRDNDRDVVVTAFPTREVRSL